MSVFTHTPAVRHLRTRASRLLSTLLLAAIVQSSMLATTATPVSAQNSVQGSVTQLPTPAAPKRRTLCVSTEARRGCARTISEAITRASPGDAIVIAAGTYTEPVILDRPVVLVGGYNRAFTKARANDTVLAGGLTIQRASAIYNLTVKGSVVINQPRGWRSLLERVRIVGDGADICVALSNTSRAVIRRSFLSYCQTAFAGGQLVVSDTTLDTVATGIASSNAIVRDSIFLRIGVHVYLQSVITATNNIYRDVPLEQAGFVPVNFGSTVHEVSAQQLDQSTADWVQTEAFADGGPGGRATNEASDANPGFSLPDAQALDGLSAQVAKLNAPEATSDANPDAGIDAGIDRNSDVSASAPANASTPKPLSTASSASAGAQQAQSTSELLALDTSAVSLTDGLRAELTNLLRGPLCLPQAVVSLAPIYGLIGLLVLAIVFSNARISSAVHLLRRAHLREAETANAALLAGRKGALSGHLDQPNGWVPVAAQLIANTLGETITIDVRSGVLDVASRPAPRFTVLAEDGRAFTFTVSLRGLGARRPNWLRGTRAFDLGAADFADALDAQTLWEHLSAASRTLPRTAIPRRFTWHLVAKQAHAPSPLRLRVYALMGVGLQARSIVFARINRLRTRAPHATQLRAVQAAPTSSVAPSGVKRERGGSAAS